MTTIDLNTVIIPDTRKIWVVHPGKNKKFFSDFELNSRIYLEYPGLNLSEEDLENDELLRQKIRYSLAITKYEGFVRPDGSQIRLADFEGASDNDVAVYMRTVKHLFLNMQPGVGTHRPAFHLLGPINPRGQSRSNQGHFVYATLASPRPFGRGQARFQFCGSQRKKHFG